MARVSGAHKAPRMALSGIPRVRPFSRVPATFQRRSSGGTSAFRCFAFYGPLRPLRRAPQPPCPAAPPPRVSGGSGIPISMGFPLISDKSIIQSSIITNINKTSIPSRIKPTSTSDSEVACHADAQSSTRAPSFLLEGKNEAYRRRTLARTRQSPHHYYVHQSV